MWRILLRRHAVLLLALFALPVVGRGETQVEFGPLIDLRTDEGSISFGTIISADVVSWSAPQAQDLLIARLWDGVYLYPSADLQTIGEPVKLCDQLGHVVLMVEPVDWDGDGVQEAIGTDRQGKILALRRVGTWPDLRLEAAVDPLVTAEGLPFNIPFVNPKYRHLPDPAASWHQDFNYTYPTRYAPAGRNTAHLIVGDWGGELWYLPWEGVAEGKPLFGGQRYAKRDGREFARPRHLLVDEQGETLLIGTGKEGGVRYPGGASRPVMYRNPVTQTDDLLVLSGMTGNELRHLQHRRTGPAGEPVFRDAGSVTILDLPDDGYDAYNYHAVLEVVDTGSWPDLLLTRGCDIAVCRNTRSAGAVPEFRFSHWISGRGVPTRGYNFTEVLTDARGRRYLLENDTQWHVRELTGAGETLRLASRRLPVCDQHGRFRVDGETDLQHGADWGFHRAALWDYDGSRQQHLIVGTDKGLLYLLKQEHPLGADERFEFRSFGPLRDEEGTEIRVHHRLVAAPLDLDADGRLDLVLAAASMGPDPHQGSGLYYSRNLGVEADGTPRLSPVQPLPTIGHVHPPFVNHHAQLQTLDLLGTGEPLLVAGTQLGDNFRGYVYRPARGRIALEHTGLVLPPISIEERLLDLDGDGTWEYVRSGGESLIAKYAKVTITTTDAGGRPGPGR